MNIEFTTSNHMGTPKIVVILLLPFFPLLGVFLSFSAIYVFYDMYIVNGNSLPAVLFFLSFIIPVAVLCYILGWLLIENGMARYTFTDNGLIAKYPFRKPIIVPWDDFQQVCICYAAYTTRGKPRASTVICCVKKGERKTSVGRWKTDNPFRYRSVICIPFREALLNGLKKTYPGEVVDLRDTLTYRLM